jgi:DNA-binding SARP family transcriptional activator/Tfp pilus assembly protein PilF
VWTAESGGVVELRVLGSVEIRAGDRSVQPGRPQQRLVLAALAVDAGRPVPVETLVDRVWDEAPPGARRTLHVLVTGVRRALEQVDTAGEPALVLRQGGGYTLHLAPDRVDVLRYRRLAAQARQPHCPDDKRLELLHEAMDLWRGTPLSGLPGRWAARTRAAWSQEHLDTVVAWARAELQAGDPGAVLGPLGELAGEQPLAESVAEVLMRALSATGRPAEALLLYATVQQRLADELGAYTGPALQAAHREILRDRPAAIPAAARPDTRTPTPAPPVPRQLPAGVAYFAGRTGELAALTDLLGGRAGAGGTVVISAIGGTAGVGKTALAVHWAHRIADRYPDGQLYVNLHGFDAGGPALDPAEALRRFLDALGVPPQRIPAELEAQAPLYRSAMAGRRMLVVLDNARDAAQVRPLLPGAPGCLVLVTSRDPLAGLVATEGADPLPLDLLRTEEAHELLTRRLGARRVRAEPAAVHDIIARCARLPLALAIVAARAASTADLPLATLAGQLRHSHQRLDTLSTGEAATDVRAVFSWSYRALTPAAARLFRLLGLHPGPDVSAPAAASLAGIPPDAVRPLLAELTGAGMLVEHAAGRYTSHDLLRAYAADLAHTTDPDEQRRAATGRILDHYLHTAYVADRLLDPTSDLHPLGPPRPGVTPEHVTDHQHALDWFTAEHRVLLVAVDHAAEHGFEVHTDQLTWALWTFLDRRGHWHDQVAAGRAAVAAAGRLADPAAAARAHRAVANAYTQQGRYDDADTELRHALDLATRSGDRAGQARTHRRLAYLWERRGHPARALDHVQQALRLYRAAGHRSGQAGALGGVGWYHALAGDYERAITYCRRALALHQQLGDGAGAAGTWDSLGYAHHHLGRHAEARDCYQRALTLFRDLGDRYLEADTLVHLGDSHHASGHPGAARDAWQLARTILDDLHHPDADRVHARLTGLAALDPHRPARSAR